MIEKIRKTKEDEVEILKNFGWVVDCTEVESYQKRVGRGHHKTVSHKIYYLVRNTEMLNYEVLAALEKKYFYLDSKRMYYEPADGWLAFVLFLLLIFPGIIYCAVKNTQKTKVEENNQEVFSEKEKVIKEAKGLLGGK